jgi:hypothetical protein
MKLNPTTRAEHALTRMEVLLLVVIMLVWVALGLVLISSLQQKRDYHARIKCVGNLKNLALSYKVFANDNDDKFPFATTNALAGGNDHTLWLHFQAMSNECGSAKILMCPADRERLNNIKADFTAGPLGLASAGNAALGYGASLDADETLPNAILAIDRNLVTNAMNLFGKVFIATAAGPPPEWDTRQHNLRGNLALADGSVQQVTHAGMAALVRDAGLATNRLLLPLLP